jgi:hypothetical protein
MTEKTKIDSRGPMKGRSHVVLKPISRGMSWIAPLIFKKLQMFIHREEHLDFFPLKEIKNSVSFYPIVR